MGEEGWPGPTQGRNMNVWIRLRLSCWGYMHAHTYVAGLISRERSNQTKKHRCMSTDMDVEKQRRFNCIYNLLCGRRDRNKQNYRMTDRQTDRQWQTDERTNERTVMINGCLAVESARTATRLYVSTSSQTDTATVLSAAHCR